MTIIFKTWTLLTPCRPTIRLVCSTGHDNTSFGICKVENWILGHCFPASHFWGNVLPEIYMVAGINVEQKPCQQQHEPLGRGWGFVALK
jgi:hypothetical protein